MHQFWYANKLKSLRSWHDRARDNKKQLARISGYTMFTSNAFDSFWRKRRMKIIQRHEWKGLWCAVKTAEQTVLWFFKRMVNSSGKGFSNNPNKSISHDQKEENDGSSTVHLPPITLEGWTVGNSTAIECEYCVIKATISAHPILHPNQCTVAVMYLGQLQLAFFRLGKDITWNYVDQRHSLIDDVDFIGGRIYAVDDWSKLLCIPVRMSRKLHATWNTSFLIRLTSCSRYPKYP